jgi:hypothetical protein
MSGDDHRRSVEERRCVHLASPQHLTSESRFALARMQSAAHRRANSVRTYEHIAVVSNFPSTSVPEARHNFVRRLLNLEKRLAATNGTVADPLAHGAQKQHLQFAAMNRILRSSIAGA